MAVFLIPDSGEAINDYVVATEWEALASAKVLVPELSGGAWNLDAWAAAAAVIIENFAGQAGGSNCIGLAFALA